MLILILCVRLGRDSALLQSALVSRCRWSAHDTLCSKDLEDPYLSGQPPSGVPPLSLSVHHGFLSILGR